MPRYRIVFTSPKTWDDKEKVWVITKAYAFEFESKHIKEGMKLLRSTFSTGDTLLSPRMKYDNPVAFANALRSQNKYMAETFVISLVNLLPETVKALSPWLYSTHGVKDVVPAFNVDETGHFFVVLDKQHFTEAKDKLIQEFDHEYALLPDDVKPTAEAFYGPPGVSKKLATISAGEKSFTANSALTFSSMSFNSKFKTVDGAPHVIATWSNIVKGENKSVNQTTVSELSIQTDLSKLEEKLEQIENDNAQRLKEQQEENERRLQAQQEANERRMRLQQQENDQRMKQQREDNERRLLEQRKYFEQQILSQQQAHAAQIEQQQENFRLQAKRYEEQRRHDEEQRQMQQAAHANQLQQQQAFYNQQMRALNDSIKAQNAQQQQILDSIAALSSRLPSGSSGIISVDKAKGKRTPSQIASTPPRHIHSPDSPTQPSSPDNTSVAKSLDFWDCKP